MQLLRDVGERAEVLSWREWKEKGHVGQTQLGRWRTAPEWKISQEMVAGTGG